jgi:hypothetical protein
MSPNTRPALHKRQAACYSFFGLRLSSEMPLSSVPLCTEQDAPSDVNLEFGIVGDGPAEAVWRSPFTTIATDGTIHTRIEGIARCLLRAGKQLVIEPAPTAQMLAIEAMLMGPLAGMLLHQRGILPLQASAVEINGGVIALAGSAGRGKSSLAAALCRRGATLFCDGICPLKIDNDKPVQAQQGGTSLCLWPAMVSQFPEHEWMAIRSGMAKQVAKLHESILGRRRLTAIMRLAPDRGDRKPGLRRLTNSAAMFPLMETIYQLVVGRALGHGAAIFRDSMRLAGEVPIFEIQRTLEQDRRGDIVDWILDVGRSL